MAIKLQNTSPSSVPCPVAEFGLGGVGMSGFFQLDAHVAEKLATFRNRLNALRDPNVKNVKVVSPA